MSTHLCPQGHIAKMDESTRQGWAHCATCQQWYNRGQLSSVYTEAERLQDLADAEMMLAALDADPTLETKLAGMTYDESVQFVKESAT